MVSGGQVRQTAELEYTVLIVEEWDWTTMDRNDSRFRVISVNDFDGTTEFKFFEPYETYSAQDIVADFPVLVHEKAELFYP